jgi:group I intron endonuclease
MIRYFIWTKLGLKRKYTLLQLMTRLQPFFNTIEIFISSLHLTEIQDILRKELKSKSGIYGYICKSNNKLYIGSSINLSDRFRQHIKGSRSNVLLQNAINKYTLQDFIFVIFEYCEQENLISREQFYFDEIKPEYNILEVAGSLLGFKHSEKVIAKMSSKTLSAETKALISTALSGRSFSAETKALISEALTGENNPMYGKIGKSHPMFGKSHSAETLAKMSATKGTAIYVYDTEGTLVNTFSSARKAALHFDVSKTTIFKYVRNEEIFKEQWLLSMFKF